MKITPSRPPRHQSIPRPLIPWCESDAFALRTHRCDLRAFVAMGAVGMGTDTLHLDFSTRLCCRRKLTCSLDAHFAFAPRGSWGAGYDAKLRCPCVNLVFRRLIPTLDPVSLRYLCRLARHTQLAPRSRHGPRNPTWPQSRQLSSKRHRADDRLCCCPPRLHRS